MADKPRIIVSPSFRSMDEVFSPADRAALDELCEVVWGQDQPMPRDQFDAAAREASAIVFGDWPWNDQVLQDPPAKLRALLDLSGGVKGELDYRACFARGIYVGSVAPAFARQVAEMALAMTLDACREVSLGDRAMRAGKEQWLHAGNARTFMLFGKAVGFVGYGSIARLLHRLMAPFGIKAVAYDPWIPDRLLEREGVTPISLEAMCDAADVVEVLAVPTPENAGLISRSLLERLKPGAVVAVMSRAHVVDFDALSELVLAGRIRAAIDVYPPGFEDGTDQPIRQAEHAVHSAHRAGSVREGLWEIGQMVVDDLSLILKGLPPRSSQRVTPEVWAKLAGMVNR